jgi:hypothetical protein
MMHRLGFALCVICLRQAPILQIAIVSFLCSVRVLYTVQIQPFTSSILNLADGFGEVMMMLFTNCCIVFTALVPDPALRYYYGRMFVFALCCVVVLYSLMVLLHPVGEFFVSLKKIDKPKEKGLKRDATRIGIKDEESEENISE